MLAHRPGTGLALARPGILTGGGCQQLGQTCAQGLWLAGGDPALPRGWWAKTGDLGGAKPAGTRPDGFAGLAEVLSRRAKQNTMLVQRQGRLLVKGWLTTSVE